MVSCLPVHFAFGGCALMFRALFLWESCHLGWGLSHQSSFAWEKSQRSFLEPLFFFFNVNF